jgi:hypothetical protein
MVGKDWKELANKINGAFLSELLWTWSKVETISSKCEKNIMKNMKLVISQVFLLHGNGMNVFITFRCHSKNEWCSC